MIFKNDYADYSAVSIGIVDIPVELGETTKEVLAKYTKSLTNKQKGVFDAFVCKLVDNGLWDRIDRLYLPLLAGTPSEALYDYAANEEHSVAADNGFYVIGNSGLKVDPDAANKTAVPIRSGQEGVYNTVKFLSLKKNTESLSNTALLSPSNLYIGGDGVNLLWTATKKITVVPISEFAQYNTIAYRETSVDRKFYSANATLYFNGDRKDIGNTMDGQYHNFPGRLESYIGSFNSTVGNAETESLLLLEMTTATDEEMLFISNAIDSLIKGM